MTSVLATQGELLAKSAEFFDAAPLHTFSTAATTDQDPFKLAQDIQQVLVSFKSSSTGLKTVDSMYGTEWKAKWDRLSDKYNDLLIRTRTVATNGANYIESFNQAVLSASSTSTATSSVVAQKIKDWLDTHLANDSLRNDSMQLSQDFKDLSDEIAALRNTFSQFAIQKGASYEAELSEYQRRMEALQTRISWEQSAAAEAQRALDGILAGLSFILGALEWLFSFGHSSTLIRQGKERLQKHIDAARGKSSMRLMASIDPHLRNEKNAVAAQAKQIAIEKSNLHHLQIVMSIYVQDVVDVSSRLGRFADMWATSHSDFIELRNLLDDASVPQSSNVFRNSIQVITSTSTVFAHEMKRFLEALDAVSSSSVMAYVLSAQFGGSDKPGGELFNDARTLDLDPHRPIVNISVTSGWVVDGLKVTYRLRNGKTQEISHGTVRAGTSVLTINDGEYISEVTGKSGHANNGEPWMGDCVQQIQFKIVSASGAQRSFGPFGRAVGLEASATHAITWSGRLLAFAGFANDRAGQVGLRGISFVQEVF